MTIGFLSERLFPQHSDLIKLRDRLPYLNEKEYSSPSKTASLYRLRRFSNSYISLTSYVINF